MLHEFIKKISHIILYLNSIVLFKFLQWLPNLSVLYFLPNENSQLLQNLFQNLFPPKRFFTMNSIWFCISSRDFLSKISNVLSSFLGGVQHIYHAYIYFLFELLYALFHIYIFIYIVIAVTSYFTDVYVFSIFSASW